MNKIIKKIPSKFIDLFDQSKIDIKVIIDDNSKLNKKINKIKSANDLELKIKQDIFKQLTNYKKIKIKSPPIISILNFLKRKKNEKKNKENKNEKI